MGCMRDVHPAYTPFLGAFPYNQEGGRRKIILLNLKDEHLS